MAGNIILYFSVLASAFRLKAPLPPYLPPAEEARERLVCISENAWNKLLDEKKPPHLLIG